MSGVPPRLSDVDLSARIGKDDYEDRLAALQRRLSRVQQAYLTQGRSAAIVFEGWDAAGKGGCIRRISAAMDPRGFKVWPIAAPRPYHLERHFLLRFMERMPPHGGVSAFDRSWYGRVMVERVEGFAPEARWRQAYDEINDFERWTLDHGTRLVKLFFHISPEEQLKRFEDRLRDPLKRWKLSYEDFRNRDKWDAYAAAIDEMFARTHTDRAPWTVISGEQKRWARIAAIARVAEALERDVDLSPPAMDADVVEAARAAFDLSPALVRDLSGRTD